MVRVWLVIGVIGALFYIYSIVDCALAERERVRGVPKAAWIPIVIVFAVIGGILWFLIGRGRASQSPADVPRSAHEGAGPANPEPDHRP